MVTARELRVAALRAAIFVVAGLVGLGAADRLGQGRAVSIVAAVALAMPLWLLELRAASRGGRGEPSEPFLVWLLGGLGYLLWFAQSKYLEAVMITGRFDVGMEEAWAALEVVVDRPLVVAVVLLAAGCPFALAAHVRLRGYEPRSTVFLTAFALVTISLCLIYVVVPVLVVAVVALLLVYAAADWIDERLWTAAPREEREAFAAVAARLPRSTVWLLAYLDHAPARDVLGFRAPEAPSDLQTFMQGLEPAGRMTAVRAAAAVAQLVLPFLEERRPGDPGPRALLDAIDAWLADPTDARRKDARAALDGWTVADEPAARALREAALALEGEHPWATRVAVRCATSAALLAAEVMQDAAGVREAVRAALRGWALGTLDAPA